MSNNTATKYLSEKTVFQSKHFRIQQIEIERNGKTFTKDIIERMPSVLILPYTENNDIYMEFEYRDIFKKEVCAVVAGNIDWEEDPLEAAKRELKEETGMTAAHWQRLAAWDLSVNMKAKIHVFAATGLEQGEQELNDDEQIKVIKLPLDEAIEKALSGEITAASHIATLLLFDKLRKERDE